MIHTTKITNGKVRNNQFLGRTSFINRLRPEKDFKKESG